jgi:hypothetical protein
MGRENRPADFGERHFFETGEGPKSGEGRKNRRDPAVAVRARAMTPRR